MEKKREKSGGRQKGTPNKVNADIKKMIVGALLKCGGEKYLIKQAQENPNAYLALLAKILPKDINASIDTKGQISITLSKTEANL